MYFLTAVLLLWQYAGVGFNMQAVENVPGWLFQKINTVGADEINRIVKVLWGIWFFRNKKVWEGKVVSHVVAMDWSARSFSD